MIAGKGMLDLGDQQLEYRFIGPQPDKAPTIVMLHEGLGCVGLWGSFPDQLAAASDCGIFVYSRAGYGGSSPVALPRPLSYMHDEALKILPRLLDAIGFQRGGLLGHSDGASIAAIFAGGIVDPRVADVSLMAPHFFTEEMGLREIARAKELYEAGDLKPRLARWHRNVDVSFYGWSDAWLDPGFRNWNLTEYLPRISCALQVVQGEDDPYGTMQQVDVVLDKVAGAEAVRLPQTGHSPHRDAPQATLEAVAGFFTRALGPNSKAASRSA